MKRILFLMTLLLTMLYGRAATEVTFDFAANEWKHPLGTALDSDPGNLDELMKDDVLVVFKQAKHKDYPRVTGRVRKFARTQTTSYASWPPQAKPSPKLNSPLLAPTILE